MADTFRLEVATPERLFVDEQVVEAQIPGKKGYMGILAGHAPLLSGLGAGVLSYGGEGTTGGVLAVDGGFVEVFDNTVRVLADHAEFARDIKVEVARRQLEEAERALHDTNDNSDYDANLFAVQRALAW